jgi:ATP-dependent DNA helicase PIF1
VVTKLRQLIASLVQASNDGDTGGLKPQEPMVQPVVAGGGEPARPDVAQDDNPGSQGETEVTDEFQRAFELIAAGNPFVFVTGRAGTGKSTFISLLKKRLKSYAVVAPTGVAALNVGGQTIHSFFKFPARPIELSSIRPVRNRIAYQALRTLIIDEISMVRADLLDAIDTFLRHNGPKLNAPFGGVQIVVVGDLFQLPPIVATPEEQAFIENAYTSPFFFRANCLKGLSLKTVEFTRVFRQTDDEFVALLNKVREGHELAGVLERLQQRVIPALDEGAHRVVLCATNGGADGINYDRLRQLSGPSHSYQGVVTGEFRIELNKLPAPMTLEFKEGAQVMFVKNDKDKRWVNGTLGVVARCNLGSVDVDVETPFGSKRYQVVPDKWETFEYRYNFTENSVAAHEVGKYEQIPLMLAWAVTIHKSQGKTFDRVHVDLGYGAFAEGQVYVALSRCRTLDGLTMARPINHSDIKLHDDVVAFARGGYSLVP